MYLGIAAQLLTFSPNVIVCRDVVKMIETDTHRDVYFHFSIILILQNDRELGVGEGLFTDLTQNLNHP